MKNLIFTTCFLLWFLVNGLAQTATAPSGSGTSGDPYLIASLENLYWITQSTARWSQYYKQTANIDASATSGWASGAGFLPIGNSSTTFTGSYDGDGHYISNIFINRPATAYIGLFGYVNTSGSISNLGVSVDINGQMFVGALVGFMSKGTVSKCFSTGTVKGAADGTSYGGLIGLCYSPGPVVIEKCYSSADVIAAGYNTGGLVGGNWFATSTIRDSYSTGSVTRNIGTSTDIGAFCGYNNSGVIQRCYTTGSVSYTSGTPTDKGFLGRTSGASVSANYWDSDVSNQSSASGATAKTTSEMQTLSTFSGWDFVSTWIYNASAYPTLGLGGISTLPLTWLDFTAQEEGMGIRLKWSTMAESNTKDFIPEHSADGRTWQPIGSVPAAGNSTGSRQYTLLHSNPLRSVNYYRISQRDIDGRSSFSKTIRITLADKVVQNLFPNPAVNNKTTIVLQQDAVITVFSPTGSLVLKLNLQAGVRELNLGGLAKGVYSIRVNDKENFLLLNQ